MNFDFTDEQRLLSDSAERYIRERYSFEERRHLFKNPEGFSRQHWNAFAEMGWLALDIPEEFGGLGGSSHDLVLLMEQLGSGLVAEPLVDSAVLCARVLRACDNLELRERLLAQVAAGDVVLALAHQEQQMRHEYDFELTTKARPVSNGWNLSGGKHRVFHGASADYWVVSAEIEGTGDFALFLLERHPVGAAVDSYELIDGTRAADITLDHVVIPESALLIRGEAAQEALEEALDHAVLATSAACLGSMEQVMAMTADYLKTRVQYGQPLAQFQALQHRMAEMFIETDQARSMLFSAVRAVESGDSLQRRLAISGAKVIVTRAQYFVSGQGIQLHGGIGTTDEYAVGHHYKAAVVYDKRFGDSEFHLDRSNADLRPADGRPLRSALNA
ncbi:acyl-CoA dehydrogenase family protein [Metapseudomonas resinovorans]|uniref:Putative acyl-CoA dehydrogenase n=1 Tax=Metapseudomonas resinovorans NBRC 106553 TaxID=1245471 RepID=S6BHK1_METRE|nr:acyl-CoA dehydrogenase [Pseudomonas resinovorans]BAN48574.1 putative acyl-CoA dehydrogenase [Pseudomonas resinovorans NBRC 106553]